MLSSADISTVDKLRLGLLYVLRYETSANLPQLKETMVEGGVPRAQVELLEKLLQYAGEVSSAGPLVTTLQSASLCLLCSLP